jgi:hypothetical protein
MENFRRMIQTNPQKTACVEEYKKNSLCINPSEHLWGGEIRQLNPPKLVTAWLLSTDPIAIIAGQNYISTMVRDKSFELQTRALQTIRGNRKLTKGKMADAMSSMKPSEDDTRVIASILYILHGVQTVCFDIENKTLWTEPQDLRTWSSTNKTLWVDARCQRVLDWSDTEAVQPNLSKWLDERDEDRWTIPWPTAEGTFEEIKTAVTSRNLTVRPATFGEKIKKEDWARTLGKAQAIEHLLSL